MPQMFPMPAIFLMIMVMALFLLSMVRIYWHCLGGTFLYFNNESKATASSFNQSW